MTGTAGLAMRTYRESERIYYPGFYRIRNSGKLGGKIERKAAGRQQDFPTILPFAATSLPSL